MTPNEIGGEKVTEELKNNPSVTLIHTLIHTLIPFIHLSLFFKNIDQRIGNRRLRRRQYLMP